MAEVDNYRTKTFSSRSAELTCLNFSLPHTDSIVQIDDALNQCYLEVGQDTIARQTVFMADQAPRDLIEQAFAAMWGKAGPVTSFVYQAPAGPEAISVEIWAFSGPTRVTQYGNHATVTGPDGEFTFVGALETREDESPVDGTYRILGEARDRFEQAGSSFRNVVRTWYYIGNILRDDGEGMRYYPFNGARNDFYADKWPDLTLSPASTGIGMNTDRIAFEAFTFDAESDRAKVVWIDNPLQTPPHRYAIDVNEHRKPSFSRAAAVVLGDCVLLFISGTASVRNSEVIHPDDVEAQTRVTIENMAALTGDDNFACPCDVDNSAGLDALLQYRVYVKHGGDLPVVRDVCRAMLPDVPGTFMIADVCRPGFLVEIEAVGAYRK